MIWLLLTAVLGFTDGSPDQGSKSFVVKSFTTVAECEAYRRSVEGRSRVAGMIDEIAKKSVEGQKITISNRCVSDK